MELIGTLEDHADTLAQHYNICALRIDIVAIEGRLSLCTRAWNEIVHTIERAQKGRFAAARGTDQRGNLAFAQGYCNIIQCLLGTIIKVQVFDIYLNGSRCIKLLVRVKIAHNFGGRTVQGSSLLGCCLSVGGRHYLRWLRIVYTCGFHTHNSVPLLQGTTSDTPSILHKWILFMQRDGRIYNKAITQNHEPNIAPGKSLADEVWTAFI